MAIQFSVTAHAQQRARERTRMEISEILNALNTRGVVTYAGGAGARYRGIIFWDAKATRAMVAIVSHDDAIVTFLPARSDDGRRLAISCERHPDGTPAWYGVVHLGEIRTAVQLGGADPDAYYPRPPDSAPRSGVFISARFQTKDGAIKTLSKRKTLLEPSADEVDNALASLAVDILHRKDPVGLTVYATDRLTHELVRELPILDFISGGWLSGDQESAGNDRDMAQQ